MRWLKLSIGFAVTAGFVWLLARKVDLDALGQAFAGLSVSTVLFALAFLAAGTFDWFATQGIQAYGASTEVAVALALTAHAVLWASSTAAGLFCLLAHSIRPWRTRGLLPVPARRESSAPPTTDKPPAMPQASAAAIRAGTAGEARCKR